MGTMRPLVKAQNDGSSANSQEIPVSMDNMCPDGNKKTNMLHLQVENIWERMSIWDVPEASEILHSGITPYLGPLESGRITLLRV